MFFFREEKSSLVKKKLELSEEKVAADWWTQNHSQFSVGLFILQFIYLFFKVDLISNNFPLNRQLIFIGQFIYYYMFFFHLIIWYKINRVPRRRNSVYGIEGAWVQASWLTVNIWPAIIGPLDQFTHSYINTYIYTQTKK